jgi:hypothetical protein
MCRVLSLDEGLEHQELENLSLKKVTYPDESYVAILRDSDSSRRNPAYDRAADHGLGQ